MARLLAVLGTAAFGSLGLLIAGTLRAEATLAVANLVYVLLLVGGGLIVPLSAIPGGTHTSSSCCRRARSGRVCATRSTAAPPACSRSWCCSSGRWGPASSRGRSGGSDSISLLAPDRADVERWAWASVVANTLIVLTGGLVRLTGSGLGCPTWPRCTDESFVPHRALGVHGVIEFGNRMLTYVLVAVVVGTFIAVWRWAGSTRELRRLAVVCPRHPVPGRHRRHHRADRSQPVDRLAAHDLVDAARRAGRCCSSSASAVRQPPGRPYGPLVRVTYAVLCRGRLPRHDGHRQPVPTPETPTRRATVSILT